MAQRKRAKQETATVYSPTARAFHWATAGAIVIMVITGYIMAGRAEANIWDATTNNLYSTHKLIGFILFWVVIWRFTYRARNGVPAPEPTLEPIHRLGSEAVHYALYALLFIVPLLGWIGISMYPALNIFGVFNLPSLTGKSDAAERVLAIHKFAAWTLVALAALHIAAALYHHLIRKDGVLARMMPGVRKG
jgi:cytochrome b561